MGNFSYEEEFKAIAKVVTDNDTCDFKTYSVIVGNPKDTCETFLCCGNAIRCEGFTFKQDAQRAYELTSAILAEVDSNIAEGLNLEDVRDEVVAAVSTAINQNSANPETDLIPVVHAINRIFDYYLSPDKGVVTW